MTSLKQKRIQIHSNCNCYGGVQSLIYIWESIRYVLPFSQGADSKRFILDVTIKIKEHAPTLAPLLRLLVQYRLTPTQADMSLQMTYTACHILDWPWMILVGHYIVQTSLGKGIGTGFRMKMFASCFHSQWEQILSCAFCNKLCSERYHNKWTGFIKIHPACSWSSKSQ